MAIAQPIPNVIPLHKIEKKNQLYGIKYQILMISKLLYLQVTILNRNNLLFYDIKYSYLIQIKGIIY